MSTCEPVRLASSVFLRSTSRCLRSAVSRASAMRRAERGEVGFQVGEFGAHAGEPRLGLRHADAERLGIDLDQRVAGIHALAFGHRDLGDLAGDVRRDEHLLRADIGVVGRDVAAGRQIEIGADRERDQREHDQQHEPQPRARARGLRDRGGARGLFLGLAQFDDVLVGHDALLRRPPRFSPRAFCCEMAALQIFLRVRRVRRIMRSIVARSKPSSTVPIMSWPSSASRSISGRAGGVR